MKALVGTFDRIAAEDFRDAYLSFLAFVTEDTKVDTIIDVGSIKKYTMPGRKIILQFSSFFSFSLALIQML